jgi:hypothetical protein
MLVAFVRYASTMTALALIASAVIVVSLRNAEPSLVVTATVSLSLIASAVLAIVRRIGFRTTAHHVDSSCRLDDCIATAVQFADADDAVSQLIVRQAQQRLESVSPGAAFPLRWGLESKALTAAAIAATVVLGIGMLRVPRWPGRPVATGIAGAGEGSVTVGDLSRPSRAATSSATRSSAPAPVARPAGSTPQSDAGQTSDPSGHDRKDPRTALAMTPALQSASVDSAAGGTSPSGRGASAATGSTARATTDGAGGVSGGRLAPFTPPTASPSQMTDYAVRYRIAADRAEEALAREQVPAELRDTVRSYFMAIRP